MSLRELDEHQELDFARFFSNPARRESVLCFQTLADLNSVDRIADPIRFIPFKNTNVHFTSSSDRPKED